MIESIGIVGAGTMGNGIAQVCAAAGLPVVMTDISDAALARGMSVVSNSLERLVNKQKMTDADRQAALARITTSTDTAKFSTCDLVIEAATENEDLKVKILKDLCAKLRPQALLATNTSSISITKLAAATDRPDRFIGLHFFNPVPLMALLELIRGLQTSDDTHAKAEAFAKRIGKVSITAKNSPGFAVNRILCPMINEAIFALQEGIATAEDLDAGMKLGCNHPIGPLALADMIGLDTMLSVMEVFYQGFNDPEISPRAALEGNGRRRPSRPQDRAGVLQLRQERVTEREHNARDGQKPACAQGLISSILSMRFGSSRLCSKNISLLVSPKSVPSSRHPASSKRGVRVVTIRGVRVAVDAMALRARGIAGRSQALSWGCERLIRAGRAAYVRVRQKRVVLAPVAGVKLAEAVRIQPGSIGR